MSSEDEQYREACRRFRDFHGRDPAPANSEIVNIGGLRIPTLGLAVGQFVGIGYRSIGDGLDYYHEFDSNSRPSVYVNADGRQIYILGGGYRFTYRGFLG